MKKVMDILISNIFPFAVVMVGFIMSIIHTDTLDWLCIMFIGMVWLRLEYLINKENKE